MTFKSFIFFLLIHLNIGYLLAQQDRTDLFSIISEIAEQSVSENPNNADFNTAFETLSDYAEKPLNLNNATEEDLYSLLFITEDEIRLILAYKTQLKVFVELDELIFVGIDESTLQLLRIFTTVKPVSQLNEFSTTSLKEGKHEVFFRWFRVLEQEKGYLGETPNFVGDKNKLYLRYKYSLGRKIQAGFSLEKDAGESFNWSQNRFSPLGFSDYKNAYLSFKGNKRFHKTIIGAYSLTLGQGLLSWNGFSLGKSSLLNQAKKTRPEIMPYSSVNEINYLRGITTQFSFNKTTFTPYFSWKKLDSKLSEDSLFQSATSIPITGLHRTLSEIESKETNSELIYGLSIRREFRKLILRSNYLSLYYRHPIEKGNRYYQTHHFFGQSLHAMSLDYKYSTDRFIVFGESAFQNKREYAHLIGVRLFPHPAFKTTILHRNYSKGYFTAYNSGFGEKSNTQNEIGTYLNSEYSLSGQWSLKFFMDFYQRKYPSFESKSPYWGQEFFFQINHNRSKSLTHYLRFNYEQNNTNSLTINTSRKVRYHLEIEPHWTLKLRSRITLKNFNESSYGYLFYQDIKYNIPHTKLHLSTRYASFGIPLFEQTIYAYENDVLFFFNTPSYRGNGSKVYALLDFPIGNHLHFWLRMSQIVFENQKSISSGNNEIKGNRKTTIHFQTRLLF